MSLPGNKSLISLHISTHPEFLALAVPVKHTSYAMLPSLVFALKSSAGLSFVQTAASFNE